MKAIPCTTRAIRFRLDRGIVVECLCGPSNFRRWNRVSEARYNEGKGWPGLWVREYGGLHAWQTPLMARAER